MDSRWKVAFVVHIFSFLPKRFLLVWRRPVCTVTVELIVISHFLCCDGQDLITLLFVLLLNRSHYVIWLSLMWYFSTFVSFSDWLYIMGFSHNYLSCRIFYINPTCSSLHTASWKNIAIEAILNLLVKFQNFTTWSMTLKKYFTECWMFRVNVRC